MTAVPAGFRAFPLSTSQLSLAAVLKCGQSFRWYIYPLPSPAGESASAPTHEYRLCLRDRLICLRQSPDMLLYRAVFPKATTSATEEAKRDAETLAWLRDYFQLDVDLDELYADWSTRDPVFKGVKDRFSGIRMLRQDPWENLVSFICSSNNHISRITGMVKSLCTNFSPPLVSLAPPGLDDTTPTSTSSDDSKDVATSTVEVYHPFPSPSTLISPSVETTLRTLGFGYRASYIQRTASLLVSTHGASGAEPFLCSLRTIPTATAREELLKFVGVGRKVADCVLLMSLDKREVVPVDTHVQQIAAKHYGLSKAKGGMTPKLYEEVNMKLVKTWGDWAGWAHSVLFTSDLRAFSTHGLPSPSPVNDTTSSATKLELSTPPTQGTKRRRVVQTEITAPLTVDDEIPQVVVKEENVIETLDLFENASLIERVKRRRRTKVVKAES